MFEYIVKFGSISNIFRIKIFDSSSVEGAGLIGLSSSSSGLIISLIGSSEATTTAYTASGSLIETITTLGVYQAPTSGKIRFKEVDSTNHPGLYEVHTADAKSAISGSNELIMEILGAVNVVEKIVRIKLDANIVSDVVTDLSNSTNGLGALKTLIDLVNTDLANTTDGLGALKTLIASISATIGTAGAGLSNINLPNQTMNITGNVSGSVGSVIGAVGSVAAINTTSGAIDLVLVVTANSDNVNVSGLASSSALATVDTAVNLIKTMTDKMVFTKANELDVNAQSINNETITGNGRDIPFNT